MHTSFPSLAPSLPPSHPPPSSYPPFFASGTRTTLGEWSNPAVTRHYTCILTRLQITLEWTSLPRKTTARSHMHNEEVRLVCVCLDLHSFSTLFHCYRYAYWYACNTLWVTVVVPVHTYMYICAFYVRVIYVRTSWELFTFWWHSIKVKYWDSASAAVRAMTGLATRKFRSLQCVAHGTHRQTDTLEINRIPNHGLSPDHD